MLLKTVIHVIDIKSHQLDLLLDSPKQMILISMDLHQLEPNMWYMHIIDEFTRFSNAHIIRHKDATVRIFMKCWISMFGAPCKVFSDNGGEFISDEFVDMCEAFRMKISTTPSYSPWSNGLCEHHNQTLTNILLKIKEDVKCDWDTALAWAVSAKNSLVNHNGYSPMQLVFGRNPNLPTTQTAELPALEPRPAALIVGKHIDANTLHVKLLSKLNLQKKLNVLCKNKYENGLPLIK